MGNVHPKVMQECARQAQLELATLSVGGRLQLLYLLGQRLGSLHALCRVGYLTLKLGNLFVALGQRRANLLVVGGAYLLERFRLLLLVVDLRVALLPSLLLVLRLSAIPLTVHGDRLPYPVGKEKACPRFHVENRLLVRHKWRGWTHASS